MYFVFNLKNDFHQIQEQKPVRMKGLEPPRRETPDPKSGAATNYATSANLILKNYKLVKLATNVLLIFNLTNKKP
jgi:hypothetical protein